MSDHLRIEAYVRRVKSDGNAAWHSRMSGSLIAFTKG